MWFDDVFPNLRTEGSQVTSPASIYYNCIAWAAGENNRWWQPKAKAEGYYWPDRIAEDYSIESLIALYQQLGYEVCSNQEYEVGYEKVAVYHQNGEYTHAARQTEKGTWSSKLGKSQDIEHNTLSVLEGGYYGELKCVMKRERRHSRRE